jgi:hypothetical protein
MPAWLGTPPMVTTIGSVRPGMWGRLANLRPINKSAFLAGLAALTSPAATNVYSLLYARCSGEAGRG